MGLQSMKLCNRNLLVLCLLVLTSSVVAQNTIIVQQQDEFLPADEAFALSIERISSERYVAQWRIAPEYYMYRDKTTIVEQDGNRPSQYQMPAGKILEDPFFGKTEVYRNVLSVPFIAQGDAVTLSYQGCADAGLCYPVQTKQFLLADATPVGGSMMSDGGGVQKSEQQSLADYLRDTKLWLAAISFFGMGLLLAFTPCVLPMVPILSMVITMAKQSSPRKAFTLSLVYVLSMAITFSIAGIAVALYGQNIQAWFQRPAVLVPFAAVFVLLALAMFGTYELRLPSSLQTRLSQVGQNRQGSLYGAVSMGFLSSLVVSPCVTPPLIGALLFVAQSGDIATGGVALLFLGLGMGAPLLLVGTSLSKLMPKPGPALDIFKNIFGFIMLGFAIWLLDRIASGYATMLLSGILLLSFAVYLMRLKFATSPARLSAIAIALVATLYGSLWSVNAIVGKSSLWLQPWVIQTDNLHAAETNHLFVRYTALTEVRDAITQATASEKPAILIFYADWCISCKELETFTFPNSSVQQAMNEFEVFEADVTAPDANSEEMLKQFGLFGPPAILFFNAEGEEIQQMRIVGFIAADSFVEHLGEALKLSQSHRMLNKTST